MSLSRFLHGLYSWHKQDPKPFSGLRKDKIPGASGGAAPCTPARALPWTRWGGLQRLADPQLFMERLLRQKYFPCIGALLLDFPAGLEATQSAPGFHLASVNDQPRLHGLKQDTMIEHTLQVLQEEFFVILWDMLLLLPLPATLYHQYCFSLSACLDTKLRCAKFFLPQYRSIFMILVRMFCFELVLVIFQ